MKNQLFELYKSRITIPDKKMIAELSKAFEYMEFNEDMNCPLSKDHTFGIICDISNSIMDLISLGKNIQIKQIFIDDPLLHYGNKPVKHIDIDGKNIRIHNIEYIKDFYTKYHYKSTIELINSVDQDCPLIFNFPDKFAIMIAPDFDD